MLVSGGSIYVGDSVITKVYQGETIVWEPQITGATVLHYRTYENRIASLDTGSTWYSSIVSHTYENGIGTITFNGVQTTFYKLFRYGYGKELTYLEIPETITHIGDGAFEYLGGYEYYYGGGLKLVAFPHTAPTLGNNVWGSSNSNSTHIIEFEYPDDADYLSWYLPGYTTGDESYDVQNNYNSIFNVLSIYSQMPPQFIWHGDTYGYAYGPSNTLGWDGNFLGDIAVRDGENNYHFYIFDRKIINVPKNAFSNWAGGYQGGFNLVFPDCTKTIGDDAFRHARLDMMPRFRGVTTLGNWALNTNSFNIIDLPSGVTSIGSYCFPSGTTRINAYGAEPSHGTFDISTSDGVLAYNKAYYYTNWRNALPASWTKQAIDMTLWPNLQDGAFYVRATGDTLTLDLSLYDSTESWENGNFYISGGTYNNTLIGEITASEERKTLTISVQSGIDYIIYESNGGCVGYSINSLTGGNILYVNESRIYGIGSSANPSTILMTKNGGDLAFYRNNEFRYGY